MLRSMREGVKGPAGKVLLAIIIVPFVFIGGMELFTDGGEDSVLSVNGQDVTQAEYIQELYTVRTEVAQQMGENIIPDMLTEERLNPMVFERLTQRKLLEQVSVLGKIELPESGINQAIVESPEFQENGKFSEARYRQIITSGNLTEASLRTAVAEYIRANQLQSGLVQSGFGVKAQSELIKAIVSEERTVNLLVLTSDSVSSDIAIEESEITAFYEESKSEHMTEFSVDAEYIVLDMAGLYEPVAEQDLQDAYEEEAAVFESTERRNVSHILLELSEQQTKDQAQLLLAEIKSRIEAGESFADLAVEFSQDPGSASAGGELGMIEQDETFPAEFEEAAFTISLNEVSDVIETDAGLHLLTVTEIEKDEMASFEERREFIEQQLQLIAARRAFVSQLESLGEETFNAADLSGPADALGLELQSKQGLTENGGSDLFSNPAVMDALFSSELLEEGLNSEPIEVSDTQAVVLRVAAQHEQRQQTLDEVRESLIAKLKGDKAKQLLLEKLDSLKQQVNAEETFAAVTAEAGLELEADLKLDRNSFQVDRAFLNELFKAPRNTVGNEVKDFESVNGDVYAYQFLAVGSKDVEGLTDDLIAQQNDALSGQTVLAAFMANLKQKAEIVRNL